MMKIYIYKFLYNNFGPDIFIDEKMMKTYLLNEYKGFTEFIQIKDLFNICKLDYTIRTLEDEKFNEANSIIEKYKKEEFKNQLDISDFDLEEFGIDNFYVISYNSILSNLQLENQNLDINTNFFNNICKPLFEKDELLFKAIELFYNPEKYQSIKSSFKIKSNNIKPILFSYRYCLNELSFKKSKGIYYALYTKDHLKYLKEQFYPGNDSKINKVYCNIINHFIKKPKEGCYVCLCKTGFYHSIESGFPSEKEFNRHCPNCSKNIGTEKAGYFSSKKIVIVNRSDYVRIFKSKKEIDELSKNINYKSKLEEINKMTLDEYKEKYIQNEKETKGKGVFMNNDKNDFRNDNKIVRNLTQISFRILNYILYSHLFFARLITNKKDNFDKYLPKGMGWVETLNECWNLIKYELSKLNINSIERFMSYIFSDLFPILNEESRIKEYERLIDVENKLNKKIMEIIKQYKEFNKNNQSNQKINVDKNSFISLLKESYTKNDYKKEDYPFYEYFYYTDYLDEKYINKKLSGMDETKYPVLLEYIKSKINIPENNNYSLTNLNLFNSVLNLINENYYNKIPRGYSEKNKLKDEKIYKDNSEKIDKFIDFIKSTDENIKLSNENYLNDFLLDDKNKFFEIYKHIYKTFAEEQNKKLDGLLNIKINTGIFDISCRNKINIQQIKENEIFTLIFPKDADTTFIDIIFNSSYRKIIDSETRSNDSYKEYDINFDIIEEYMTDLLLKNKKLLDENVTEIIFNDEVFTNQVTDTFNLFGQKISKKNIDIFDKVSIYKFYKDNQDNSFMASLFIKDFITLIKLGPKKDIINNGKEKNNNFILSENTKISEIINKFKNDFSGDFIKLFENNDNLTFDKTIDIYLFYLKLFYKLIDESLKPHQKEISKESKILIDDYYKSEHHINKKNLANAIRLFTSLVLFLEEDKDKKIKMNRNNVINYLRASDLWSSDIYDNEDFNKSLNELKIFNVQISEILSFYEYLGKDIEDNLCENVENHIKIEESKNKKSDEPIKKLEANNEINNEDDDDDDPFAVKDDENDDDDGGKY